MVTVDVTFVNETKTTALKFNGGNFSGNGEMRVNCDNNTLVSVNGTLYKEGNYAGNFSSSMNEVDGNLKVNISGVDASNIAEVAEVVNGIVDKIKASLV